jgi:Tfp pilus assembly pilus retraction ATPase PilT
MYSAIQTGSGLGMQTLDQNLADLVRRNMISPAEARGKAKIQGELPGLISRQNRDTTMERDQASNSSTTCCG